MKKWSWPPSFRTQLLIALLTLSLGAVAVAGFISWTTARSVTERESLRVVEIGARTREDQLNRMLDRQSDRLWQFLQIVALDCGAPPDRLCAERALGEFRLTQGLFAARLTLPGIGIVESGSAAVLEESEAPDVGALARFTVVGQGRSVYVMAAREEGREIVAGYESEKHIDRIFEDRFGLGPLGETFLADSRGRFLTPPRFGTFEPAHEVSVGPMRRCLAGEDGVSLGSDYRNVRMVMAYRHIEEVGGGCIMAHLDAQVALQRVRELGRQILGLSALVAAMAVFASALISRRLSGPILRLKQRAGRLRDGDFSSPVPVEGPAEIRDFAETFAEMAASVDAARNHLVRSDRETRAALEREHDARERAEAARRDLSFLAGVSPALLTALDYETCLHTVARLHVPRIGEWCVVETTLPNGATDGRAFAAGPDVPTRAVEALAAVWSANTVSVLRKVRNGGRPEVVAGPSDVASLGAPGSHLANALTRLEAGAILVEPLRGREGVIGTVTVGARSAAQWRDVSDIVVADELAARAGVAIENAFLYRERAHAVHTFEASLSPPDLPFVPGLDIAGFYEAAGAANEVGGDFYDLFPLPDGRWGVFVGDVCGKGAEAAALTSLARYTLRALAKRGGSPADVLEGLNDAMLEQPVDRRFCTVAFGYLHPSGDLKVEMSCGGHPPPLIVRASGDVEALECRGTLLGAFPAPKLEVATVTLTAGDTILLYTDGLIEVGSPRTPFGEDRLRAVLAECKDLDADALCTRLTKTVREFSGSTPRRDDVAFVAIRVVNVRRAAEPAHIPADRNGVMIEVQLRPEARAPAEARRRLTNVLRSMRPEVAEDVRLLTSELVANGVRHGNLGPDDALTLRVEEAGRSLRVEVVHPGHGFDANLVTKGDESGWGLWLVDRLADRWGVTDEGATCVWFEIEGAR